MVSQINIFKGLLQGKSTYIQDAYTLHDVTVNQRYGDKPYSYHLQAVLNIAVYYGASIIEEDSHIAPVLFAAVFHDSIEDARLTYNDVKKIAYLNFTKEESAEMAADIVYACTNEKGKTREERANAQYYEGICNTKYASFIKMCDRMANMLNSYIEGHSMYSKYKKDLQHFLTAIDAVHNVPAQMIADLYAI